jgi:hypothetical protein
MFWRIVISSWHTIRSGENGAARAQVHDEFELADFQSSNKHNGWKATDMRAGVISFATRDR